MSVAESHRNQSEISGGTHFIPLENPSLAVKLVLLRGFWLRPHCRCYFSGGDCRTRAIWEPVVYLRVRGGSRNLFQCFRRGCNHSREYTCSRKARPHPGVGAESGALVNELPLNYNLIAIVGLGPSRPHRTGSH